MKIQDYKSLNFEDVLIKPRASSINSRRDVSLTRTIEIRGNKIKTNGIVIANMDTIGTFKMAREVSKHDCITALHKFYTFEDYLENKDFLINNKDDYLISIGQSYDDLSLLERINNEITPVKMICIDVANAYRKSYLDFIADVRSKFKTSIIMAGNVATSEGTHNLINAGVDIVKVQIGPGSMCETRLKTGVGNGTLSTVMECAETAKRLNALVISDGGIRTPADACKAFCAGADMIMIGGMVAGTDESDGDLIVKYFETTEFYRHEHKGVVNYYRKPLIEKKYKVFYGMSSEHAQSIRNGGMQSYRSSEGSVEEIECKGPVEPIILDLLGGLRSTGTYIGCDNLKDFSKYTTFIEIDKIHDKF